MNLHLKLTDQFFKKLYSENNSKNDERNANISQSNKTEAKYITQ